MRLRGAETVVVAEKVSVLILGITFWEESF